MNDKFTPSSRDTALVRKWLKGQKFTRASLAYIEDEMEMLGLDPCFVGAVLYKTDMNLGVAPTIDLETKIASIYYPKRAFQIKIVGCLGTVLFDPELSSSFLRMGELEGYLRPLLTFSRPEKCSPELKKLMDNQESFFKKIYNDIAPKVKTESGNLKTRDDALSSIVMYGPPIFKVQIFFS
ncbi:hypothetical protein CVT24_007547 [Panaeolus cyanescens]|uniref:Uncharacterized protein n=1 Tax=Panaeolus cyanescens TaxID=181874 RepID=A0A409WZX9_9AGAR|nr:hypothetical protein CVT24_007547 [Panaeolus cyanescens]